MTLLFWLMDLDRGPIQNNNMTEDLIQKVMNNHQYKWWSYKQLLVLYWAWAGDES